MPVRASYRRLTNKRLDIDIAFDRIDQNLAAIGFRRHFSSAILNGDICFLPHNSQVTASTVGHDLTLLQTDLNSRAPIFEFDVAVSPGQFKRQRGSGDFQMVFWGSSALENFPENFFCVRALYHDL